MRNERRAGQLQQITLAISHAALDPRRWKGVMALVSSQIGGLKTQLVGYDTVSTAAPVDAFSGYDADFEKSYLEHFQYRNPWATGWSQLPTGQFFTPADTLPEGRLTTTEFYHDWVRPQEDIKDGGGTVLLREKDRVFMVGGNLPSREHARSQARLEQLFNQITPFMTHALEVGRMLTDLRVDAMALRQGIEPRRASMLTLGLGGVLLHCNEAALTRLNRGEFRLSLTGRLMLDTAEARAILAAALAPAGTGQPCHAASFRIAEPDPPRQFRLLPVDPDDLPPLLTAGFGTTPAVAVLVMVEDRPMVALPDRIAAATDLTRTEAEIAVQLADGLMPSEIADTRHVSIHTVRNQVKSALGKLGFRRQADLVGLVEKLRNAER